MPEPGGKTDPKVILFCPDLRLVDLPRIAAAPEDLFFDPAYTDLDAALQVAHTFFTAAAASTAAPEAILGADARPVPIAGRELFTPHIRVAGCRGDKPAPDSVVSSFDVSDGRIVIDKHGVVRCAVFNEPNALQPEAPPGFFWGLFKSGRSVPVGPGPVTVDERGRIVPKEPERSRGALWAGLAALAMLVPLVKSIVTGKRH